MTSKSTQGFASSAAVFLDKNIVLCYNVQTAISKRGKFATRFTSPRRTQKNPNDQAIMYIALTSDSVTPGQLYNYASTQVGQRLSILPGVSQVLVFGTKSAIRIKANPSALWASGISIDDLNAAIRSGTSVTGAGQLDSPPRRDPRPPGQLENAEQYRIDCWGYGASPIYLRESPRSATRYRTSA